MAAFWMLAFRERPDVRVFVPAAAPLSPLYGPPGRSVVAWFGAMALGKSRPNPAVKGACSNQIGRAFDEVPFFGRNHRRGGRHTNESRNRRSLEGAEQEHCASRAIEIALGGRRDVCGSCFE